MDSCFLRGKGSVFFIEDCVFGVVHGVIGFGGGGPFAAVFAADDGLRDVVSTFIFSEFEPFMLDDSGPRGVTIGVIHGGVSLEIRRIEGFGLEADAAVFEESQAVAEVGVDGAGVDDFLGGGVPCFLIGEVIDAAADLDAFEHPRDHLGVSADGDALETGVEVVVVKGETDGQAPDDEGGELGAGATPLFLGVPADEGFINIGADEGYGLFFEVFRLGDAGGAALLFDFRGGRFGRGDAPHGVEGVHIEGEAVELSFIICDG